MANNSQSQAQIIRSVFNICDQSGTITIVRNQHSEIIFGDYEHLNYQTNNVLDPRQQNTKITAEEKNHIYFQNIVVSNLQFFMQQFINLRDKDSQTKTAENWIIYAANLIKYYNNNIKSTENYKKSQNSSRQIIRNLKNHKKYLQKLQKTYKKVMITYGTISVFLKRKMLPHAEKMVSDYGIIPFTNVQQLHQYGWSSGWVQNYNGRMSRMTNQLRVKQNHMIIFIIYFIFNFHIKLEPLLFFYVCIESKYIKSLEYCIKFYQISFRLQSESKQNQFIICNLNQREQQEQIHFFIRTFRI